MRKRLLSLGLCLVLALTMLPTAVFAAGETSGSCGTSATWSFDESTGTLTVSGTGPMTDSGSLGAAPWKNCDITSVVIGEGITRIGDGAFGGDLDGNQYPNIKRVTLPSTLRSIGESAFGGAGITSITIPNSVTEIRWGAFLYTNLTSVHIPDSVTTLGEYNSNIGWYGFPFDIYSLETITIGANNPKFTAENNVVYTKDKTAIIFYPYHNSQEQYIIPKTVKEVDLADFIEREHLKEIVIPKEVKLVNKITPGEHWFDTENYIDHFSVYFYGSAPENLDEYWFGGPSGLCCLDIYYIEGTAGWSKYTSQRFVDEETNRETMIFRTWNPGGGSTTPTTPTEPTEPTDPTTPPTTTTSFTDVPAGAYYADAVAWAVEKGITTGTGADTFSPAAPCTRAQVVTFLWRAAGCPTPTGDASFTDIPSDAYYRDAVTWAVEKGITNGTGAGLFSPDAAVSRAQTVTFLYRFAGSPAAAGGSFADVDSGAYYADAVAWAVSQEITNGTGPAAFSPNDLCTRGQIVTFLYRAD